MNTTAIEAVRSAGVFVFAVHAHIDQALIDPLSVNQWEFYVLGTPVLTNRAVARRESP